jgi:hypothetical protein
VAYYAGCCILTILAYACRAFLRVEPVFFTEFPVAISATNNMMMFMPGKIYLQLKKIYIIVWVLPTHCFNVREVQDGEVATYTLYPPVFKLEMCMKRF